MESLDKTLNNYIDNVLGPRDSRVKGWLLLDSYVPTFLFTVLYLFIVWIGPKYMQKKQPLSCRSILVIYNLGVTLLSLYMFYELVTGVWEGGYNFFCQDTHSAGEADLKIIRVLWWYYFSKLIEFMDTFFFILRKNNHQISVLHVYHHASMLNIWWFVMNWVPCGHSYFGATLNSFIHVLMYSYYGLSAIPAVRPYLWWKKYITQCQLIFLVNFQYFHFSMGEAGRNLNIITKMPPAPVQSGLQKKSGIMWLEGDKSIPPSSKHMLTRQGRGINLVHPSHS
uniref:Elongation of very long chain fatty acids protein n=1 Tax=Geotrypetes seraphini TaxID=260995 RepID=A0A6P8QA75_GEOSA|nr:elongation of very long chain fatty acids protein 5 isoform X2 [Geotrypetes seraphini]